MKKRLLHILLALCMVWLLVPQAVLAETDGAFTVTGGTKGTDYTYSSGVLTIKSSTPLTIQNQNKEKSTKDRIAVDSTAGTNITLAGVNISADDNKSAFLIRKGSGTVTITLADGSKNTLTSGCNYAGLQKENEASLRIKGDTNGTGALTATGGNYGAGIGGGSDQSASGITISGGNITATGGDYGAGIGGGRIGAGSNITISGGTVIATGGGRSNFYDSYGGGAGIGGGHNGAGQSITITGGMVTATGKDGGAGIGGGHHANGSDITINGGTVTATSKSSGAGIGGGSGSSWSSDDFGHGTNIKINGGTVTATSTGGAGIGGGSFGKGSDITITNGTVIAAGGSTDAGIGGSSGAVGSNITISGGIVRAIGGSSGVGIGGGSNSFGKNITISGGIVSPAGGEGTDSGSPGICVESSSDITITGGSVRAVTYSNSTVSIEDKEGNAVFPTNGEGETVYLLEIDTDGVNPITIDGKEYQPKHTFYIKDGDGFKEVDDQYENKVYAYVTGGEHTVIKNGVTYTYHLCDLGHNKIHHIANFAETYTSDENGHWYACLTRTGNKECTVQSGYATHSGGTATCVSKAKCDACSAEYGELDEDHHTTLKHVEAKAATTEEDGNIEYWYCEDCGKCFSDAAGENEIEQKDTVTNKLAPQIVEGNGQSVMVGDAQALTFRSNAPFKDFIRVEVDGSTVNEKNYSVKEGSTVVTLNADYVATLAVGEHTLGVVSQGGTATTTFTVKAALVANLPKTGDESHMALWLALLAVSGGLLIAMGAYGKKHTMK